MAEKIPYIVTTAADHLLFGSGGKTIRGEDGIEAVLIWDKKLTFLIYDQNGYNQNGVSWNNFLSNDIIYIEQNARGAWKFYPPQLKGRSVYIGRSGIERIIKAGLLRRASDAEAMASEFGLI